jgi:molybdate transport system substrate-binding protein
MKARTLLIAAAVCLITFAQCVAEEITVAAAADLQFAFQEVATRFEKATGAHAKVSFGSSGNFFTQIQNGAPFDVFFSADVDYCKKLEAGGLIEPGSLYSYAVGRIVLWVPNDSKIDVKNGLQVLTDAKVKKVAIANPEHAPYGRAAVAALKHEKLYDAVSPKFVLGENISQAASFVTSGAADAGIVALSLALAPSMKDKGKYFEIANEDYPTITQAAVILKSSQHKAAAQKFMDFVRSPEVVQLLENHGFAIPPNSQGKPHEEKR